MSPLSRPLPPRQPHDSERLDRMSDRNQSERNSSMPPLGPEVVDDEGLAAVEALIMKISESGPNPERLYGH